MSKRQCVRAAPDAAVLAMQSETMRAEAAEFAHAAAKIEGWLENLLPRAVAATTMCVDGCARALATHALLCQTTLVDGQRYARTQDKLLDARAEESHASQKLLTAAAHAGMCASIQPDAVLLRVLNVTEAEPVAAHAIAIAPTEAGVSDWCEVTDMPRYNMDVKVQYGAVEFTVLERGNLLVHDLRDMVFVLLYDGNVVDTNEFEALRDFMALPKSTQLQRLKYDWAGFDASSEDNDGQLVCEALYPDKPDVAQRLKILRAEWVQQLDAALPAVFRVEFYPTLDTRVTATQCSAKLLWPAGLQLVCKPHGSSAHMFMCTVPCISPDVLRQASTCLGATVDWHDDGTDVTPELEIGCRHTDPDTAAFDAAFTQNWLCSMFRSELSRYRFECRTLQVANALVRAWESGLIHRMVEYTFMTEEEVPVDGDADAVDLLPVLQCRTGLTQFLSDFVSGNYLTLCMYECVVTHLDVSIADLNPVQLPCLSDVHSAAAVQLLTQYLHSVLNM